MKGAEVWTPEPQTHLQHPAPPGRRGGSAAPEPSTDCADAILGGPTGASVAAAAAAAAPSPPLPPGASPTAPLAPVDATRAGMTVSSCAAEPSDPGLDPATAAESTGGRSRALLKLGGGRRRSAALLRGYACSGRPSSLFAAVPRVGAGCPPGTLQHADGHAVNAGGALRSAAPGVLAVPSPTLALPSPLRAAPAPPCLAAPSSAEAVFGPGATPDVAAVKLPSELAQGLVRQAARWASEVAALACGPGALPGACAEVASHYDVPGKAGSLGAGANLDLGAGSGTHSVPDDATAGHSCGVDMRSEATGAAQAPPACSLAAEGAGEQRGALAQASRAACGEGGAEQGECTVSSGGAPGSCSSCSAAPPRASLLPEPREPPVDAALSGKLPCDARASSSCSEGLGGVGLGSRPRQRMTPGPTWPQRRAAPHPQAMPTPGSTSPRPPPRARPVRAMRAPGATCLKQWVRAARQRMERAAGARRAAPRALGSRAKTPGPSWPPCLAEAATVAERAGAMRTCVPPALQLPAALRPPMPRCRAPARRRTAATRLVVKEQMLRCS